MGGVRLAILNTIVHTSETYELQIAVWIIANVTDYVHIFLMVLRDHSISMFNVFVSLCTILHYTMNNSQYI